MIEELKELKRLTPSAGFKDAVHARLPVPEPRRSVWPLPLAAAAGVLVGIAATFLYLKQEPAPAPTAPPRLQAALRDHAHRARTFVRQAGHAPAELIEADYQISGLGPRTRELLDEPTATLPADERRYVEVVARPLSEIGRLIDERRGEEAILKIRALRAAVDFRAALEAVGPADPAPVVAMAVEPFQEREAHDFLDARALLYARAYDAAMTRFQSFAHRYPHSDLADDAMYWTGHTALENGHLGTALNCYVYVASDGWIEQDECVALQGIVADGSQTILLKLGGDQVQTTVGNVVTSLTTYQVSTTDGQFVVNGTFDAEIQQAFATMEQLDPEGVNLEVPRQARFRRDAVWRMRDDERYGKTYRLLIDRMPFIGVDGTRPR